MAAAGGIIISPDCRPAILCRGILGPLRCKLLSPGLQVVAAALQDAQMDVEAVDWLLLHQANQRILDSASQRLRVQRLAPPPRRSLLHLARPRLCASPHIPAAKKAGLSCSCTPPQAH